MHLSMMSFHFAVNRMRIIAIGALFLQIRMFGFDVRAHSFKFESFEVTFVTGMHSGLMHRSHMFSHFAGIGMRKVTKITRVKVII